MAVAEDVLQTRFDLLGLSQYQSGLSQAGTALGLFGKKLDETAQKHLVAATAFGAVAAGALATLGKAAIAAGEDAAVFGRAANNFRAAGNAFPVEEIEAFTGGLEAQLGIADDVIAKTVGILGAYRLTSEQAKQLTPAILDTAEALKDQGISAESLADQLGKAFQTGKIGRLGRTLGIDQAAFEADRFGSVLDALQKKGGGAAAEFARTLPGAMRSFQTAVGSLQEAIGKPLLEPLTKAATFAATLIKSITNIPGAGAVLAGALAGVAIACGIAAVNSARLLFNLAAAIPKAAQLAGTLGAAGAAGGGVGGGKGRGIAAGVTAGVAAMAAGQALGAQTPGGIAADIAGAAILGGTLGGRFGPWGIAAGAVIGGGYAGYSAWQQSQAGKTAGGKSVAEQQLDEAKKTNELLGKTAGGIDPASLNSPQMRTVLGDARIVAAFARGIA